MPRDDRQDMTPKTEFTMWLAMRGSIVAAHMPTGSSSAEKQGCGEQVPVATNAMENSSMVVCEAETMPSPLSRSQQCSAERTRIIEGGDALWHAIPHCRQGSWAKQLQMVCIGQQATPLCYPRSKGSNLRVCHTASADREARLPTY